MSADSADDSIDPPGALDRVLRRLSAEPVAPSRPLTDEVLRTLRAERGFVTTRLSSEGRDRWSEAALDRLASRLAAGTAGVVHASATARAGDDGTMRATVHLTAAAGHALPELAARVRRRVQAGCEAATGIPVGIVDVHVDELA